MTDARRILARFATEEDLLDAIRASRAAGLVIEEAYTPYAVHGIEAALGLRPSRLAWVCFLMGTVGAGLMLLFQFWTSAVDWPINVGGKPFDSLPAFVPVTFEAAVLCGGLGTVLALFVRSRLWPGKRAVLAAPGVTDDVFVLVLRLAGAAVGPEDVRRILASHAPVGWEERIGREAP